jgi:GNAT superfamily N-acetyltransferase
MDPDSIPRDAIIRVFQDSSAVWSLDEVREVTGPDFDEALHHWEHPVELVRRSIENSLVFGVYADDEQVGFARVVTDYATFAYLADVFVLEAHRGRGLAKWMMEVITSHPRLQGFRRWMLATRDAHELYRKYGFAELERPEIFMEIVVPYE